MFLGGNQNSNFRRKPKIVEETKHLKEETKKNDLSRKFGTSWPSCFSLLFCFSEIFRDVSAGKTLMVSLDFMTRNCLRNMAVAVPIHDY